VTQNPNYYRLDGWKPLLGGMRTYHIEWLRPQPPESIGVEFKQAAMGHIFMGEGCFYGFLGGNHQYMNVEMPVDSYRRTIRETVYTGLAHRNPILLTWEERIVEDERVVFDRVCRMVDWSKPFRAPPVAVRVGPKQMPVTGRRPLFRCEAALSEMPLECCYIWEDEPAPQGVLFTLDARKPLVEPAFVSQGGQIPDALRAETPLRLHADFAANYSWSQDRRVLLACLRRLNKSKPALEVVLQNFPDEKLSFVLFGLAAKKAVLEGDFRAKTTLKIPREEDDLFLLVTTTNAKESKR